VIYGDVIAWEWQGSSVAYNQSEVRQKWVHYWVIFILGIKLSLRGFLRYSTVESEGKKISFLVFSMVDQVGQVRNNGVRFFRIKMLF